MDFIFYFYFNGLRQIFLYVIGSAIDLGKMTTGSKDVLVCVAAQGGFDTSTVSSSASGGASLSDVGAGSMYA